MENLWILIALGSAALFAIVNILDVLFFEEKIYINPLEPTVTSGVMQLLPWFFIPIFGFSLPWNFWAIILALCAGFFGIFSYFFYFKAIFSFKDASLAAIFWNLSLVFTPIFAFLLLEEKLAIVNLMGIFLLFLGANCMVLVGGFKVEEKKKFWGIARSMLVAVISMSLSAVLLKAAYEQIDYWECYLISSLGMAIGSLFVYMLFFRKSEKKRFNGVVIKFFWSFFLIEVINVIASSVSNFAINIGSVSLVTALESTQPVFILLFVAISFFVVGMFGKKKVEILKTLYREHMNHLSYKLVATLIMAIGAFFVSL